MPLTSAARSPAAEWRSTRSTPRAFACSAVAFGLDAAAAKSEPLRVVDASGADATIAFNGKTPADVASQNGHDEVVAALLKDAERDPASEAFCDAARRGDAKSVERSIRNGVDVDHLCPVEPRGTCTALYVASGHGNPDLIRSLLREGANVDLKGCNDPELSGRTPLHVAAAHGLTENCQLLLRAGANAEPKAASDQAKAEKGAADKAAKD